MSLPYFAHPSAVIDERCVIGAGSKIWHFCHIATGARLGEHCSLGQITEQLRELVGRYRPSV